MLSSEPSKRSPSVYYATVSSPPHDPASFLSSPPDEVRAGLPWTGFHVLLVAMFTGAALLVASLVAVLVLRVIVGGEVTGIDPMRYPEVMVGAQGLAYLLTILFTVGLLAPRAPEGVWRALRLTPATRNIGLLILAGLALALGAQLASRVLPIPDQLPIEQYFRNARSAWSMTVFGVVIAPFFEELFFRGLLYPVLARRLGMVVAVILTALPFAFIHAAQLSFSWAPLLLLFLVGAAFTWARARTDSLFAPWVMHTAYNSTLFALLFLQTSGYRNFEALK